MVDPRPRMGSSTVSPNPPNRSSPPCPSRRRRPRRSRCLLPRREVRGLRLPASASTATSATAATAMPPPPVPLRPATSGVGRAVGARPSPRHRRAWWRAARGPGPLAPQPSDRMAGGVAGGLSARFGIDANLIRIAFILVAIGAGTGLAAYVVAWLVIPAEGSTTSIGRRALADRRHRHGGSGLRHRARGRAPGARRRRPQLHRRPDLAGVDRGGRARARVARCRRRRACPSERAHGPGPAHRVTRAPHPAGHGGACRGRCGSSS